MRLGSHSQLETPSPVSSSGLPDGNAAQKALATRRDRALRIPGTPETGFDGRNGCEDDVHRYRTAPANKVISDQKQRLKLGIYYFGTLCTITHTESFNF